MQSLFFAFDGWDGKTSPCIWILRPDAVNQQSVGDDTIISPGDPRDEEGKLTALWLPRIEPKTETAGGATWTNDKPLAIYPSRSNKRIIGQLGTFTIHGTDRRPLNEILESFGNSDEFLARIDLIDIDRAAAKRSLHYLGLRQGVIYPDADHIAKDIGYTYGWLDDKT